jgi:archaellum component FlaC
MNNKSFQSHVLKSLDDFKLRFDSIDSRLEGLNSKVDENTSKIDSLIESNSKSFAIVNNLLGRLEEQVNESLRLYSQFTSDFRKRLEKLEKRF